MMSEHPTGGVRVRPLAGLVLHEPTVGLAAHRDTTHTCEEGLVAAAHAFNLVELHEPAEIVILTRNETGNGGRHVVLEDRHGPRLVSWRWRSHTPHGRCHHRGAPPPSPGQASIHR